MRAEKGKVRLREVVAQPDTVLFVGAGVSVWSGLPTWAGLITELVEFLESRGQSSRLVQRELEQGDLLQAASFGFDLLTPQDRASFLREACRYGAAKPSPLHRRLATLGPRAFITTNFDKLLEQALSTERSELTFQVVNNANLVETGSIVQSRAQDFVFKPHGDIDDSDSVVLTREQYRALQYEKQYAFEAFKTLMASRPVVFVGFGLRDPDFLLIKDTLAAVYMGAAQDHYAITAGVDDQEASYWRNNYGIHLVSYEEGRAADPTKRHSALLALLDDVAATEVPERTWQSPSEDSETLAILRHARRMAQMGPSLDVEILPLVASPYPRQGSVVPSWETRIPFMEGEAVSGLQQNRSRLLLTGAPGAGKTFVVRAAVAQMAKAVIDEALQSDERTAPIPAYIDLREYSGDLWKMVAESFPVGFPLPELVSQGRLSFFVDGLNEVSARIVEDNTLYEDLGSFLDRTRPCSAVLVTRFGEEHAELELPEIALESIPRDYVMQKLEQQGVPLAAISEEFLRLLERPVFYRFCVQYELWGERTPHAIYSAVIARLNERFSDRFRHLDLMDLFSHFAFKSIEMGDLLIAVTELIGHLTQSQVHQSDAEAMVNWLLAEGMLIPRRDQHVTFFHHSVIEHLAAYELVAQFRADPKALAHTLKGRRWDQVVLLSIGFLEKSEQESFFGEVMATDAALAIRSLAYIDDDWERWTATALDHLADLELSWEDAHRVTDSLESARISEEHEPLLMKLVERADVLGGVALAKTVELGGDERIQRAIDDVFDHADDYNRGSAVGNSLAELINQVQVKHLFARLRKYQLDQDTLEALAENEEPRAVMGLIVGCRGAIGGVPLEELRREMSSPADLTPLVLDVISDHLQDDPSPQGIELMAGLLEFNPEGVVASLHLQIAHLPEVPDVSSLRPEKHGPLLMSAEERRRDGWAIDTLRLLGHFSNDWLEWIRSQANEHPSGLTGVLLWHAAQDPDQFFSQLESFHASSPNWLVEPVRAFGMLSNVDWSGHEGLLISLLRERHSALAIGLLGGALHFGDEPVFCNLIEPGDVRWWIEWLAEPGEDSLWLRYQLGQFVGEAVTPAAANVLIEILSDGSDAERRVLTYSVLGHVKGLHLSALPEEAVAWAVDDLGTIVDEPEIDGSILATLATEKLVEDILLPRLEEADGPLRSGLLAVIRQAGERHRRRYVTTTGQPVG
jgi:SIR2-like domain